MLSSLSGKYEFPLTYLVVAKEVVETEGEATLHCCTRRHTCSKGYITGKGDVETLDIGSTLAHLERYTIDVACPRSARTVGVGELEVYTVFQVNGISHHCIFRAVGTNLGNDALVYCSREYVAPVVIGMFTDEVDASWRGIDVSRLAVEVLDKATSHKIDVHHIVLMGLSLFSYTKAINGLLLVLLSRIQHH